MGSPIKVQIEALRSLAHGSISGNYAAVGSAFANQCRIVCFTNNTDGDMIFSLDGSTDNLFIAKGSFKLFDLTTNKLGLQNIFALPVGTQIYVKQSTSPSTGSVYVEVIYGD